jgi:hypothetical protein
MGGGWSEEVTCGSLVIVLLEAAHPYEINCCGRTQGDYPDKTSTDDRTMAAFGRISGCLVDMRSG